MPFPTRHKLTMWNLLIPHGYTFMSVTFSQEIPICEEWNLFAAGMACWMCNNTYFTQTDTHIWQRRFQWNPIPDGRIQSSRTRPPFLCCCWSQWQALASSGPDKREISQKQGRRGKRKRTRLVTCCVPVSVPKQAKPAPKSEKKEASVLNAGVDLTAMHGRRFEGHFGNSTKTSAHVFRKENLACMKY